MATLDIRWDDTYYRSDSVEKGRTAKKFLKELADNVFQGSFAYYKNYNADMPLLTYNEQHKYSTFAVAIDKITPVHYSELTVGKVGKRKVDFWCADGDNSYLMELKSGQYNIGEGTTTKPNKWVEERIANLIEQIKKIEKPQWSTNVVRVGAVVISGYRLPTKNGDENALRDLHKHIADHFQQKGMQMFTATWHLPKEIKTAMSDNKWQHIFEWSSIVFFVV